MTTIEALKQKIINVVMGIDNEQALEVLYDVILKFQNPSSVAEDELTDEEWDEIEHDMKKIESDEAAKEATLAEHLKTWKNGK